MITAIILLLLAPAADTAAQARTTARTVYQAEVARQGHDCKGIEQQQPLNACIATAAHATEQHLNSFYNALRSTLDPAARNALRDAQKTWLVYRQQTCAAASDRFRGGTLAPYIAGSCQLRLTRERMHLLYDLYDIGNSR